MIKSILLVINSTQEEIGLKLIKKNNVYDHVRTIFCNPDSVWKKESILKAIREEGGTEVDILFCKNFLEEEMNKLALDIKSQAKVEELNFYRVNGLLIPEEFIPNKY